MHLHELVCFAWLGGAALQEAGPERCGECLHLNSLPAVVVLAQMKEKELERQRREMGGMPYSPPYSPGRSSMSARRSSLSDTPLGGAVCLVHRQGSRGPLLACGCRLAGGCLTLIAGALYSQLRVVSRCGANAKHHCFCVSEKE